MQPKSNLWIEKDGEVVLSRWRVNLLRAIDEAGSISAAAEKMKVSYHRAWEKLHEMETRLGVTLVESGDPLWTPDPGIEPMKIGRASCRERVY